MSLISLQDLSPKPKLCCLFRAYDAIVEGLNNARRLYTDAGPQGLEGLERTRDPVDLVKAVAMRDGQRLKSEAVKVLRWGSDMKPPLKYPLGLGSPLRMARW